MYSVIINHSNPRDQIYVETLKHKQHISLTRFYCWKMFCL